jgi:hypothetical protein
LRIIRIETTHRREPIVDRFFAWVNKFSEEQGFQPSIPFNYEGGAVLISSVGRGAHRGDERPMLRSGFAMSKQSGITGALTLTGARTFV